MFKNTTHTVLASLLLAIGIATGGYFISQTLYKSKVALNTAEVKGLAERQVEADLAYWTIAYTVDNTNSVSLKDMYAQSEADQTKIIQLLKSSGFNEEEIKLGVINYRTDEFRDNNQRLVEQKSYLTGEITVQTKQVHLVSTVRSKLNALIADGLAIQNNPPAYHFTQLNTIKPEMLKEATKNARIAAKEFASNAGVEVGGIRSARQGGFSVRDVGNEYGDTEKIEKHVRVVTTITFFLTD